MEPSAAVSSLGHYCGVAGIRSADPIDIPKALFYMLFSLQHRGQESCGVAWEEDGEWRSKRELGMVAPVLGGYLQEQHPSRLGIGHVRYATAGGSGRAERPADRRGLQ